MVMAPWSPSTWSTMSEGTTATAAAGGRGRSLPPGLDFSTLYSPYDTPPGPRNQNLGKCPWAEEYNIVNAIITTCVPTSQIQKIDPDLIYLCLIAKKLVSSCTRLAVICLIWHG